MIEHADLRHAAREGGPDSRRSDHPAGPPAPDTSQPRPAATDGARRAVSGDRLGTLLRQTVGRRTLARAPGPLNPAQEKAAVAAAKRFSRNAIRVIQVTVGTGVDGAFGPITAQAVAVFQAAIPHPLDGIVDEPTLDAMVVANHTAGHDDETLALVESFFALDVHSDTLTVRSDPSLADDSQLTLESTSLRIITIGPSAFVSGAAVRDAIQAALSLPVAGLIASGPTPSILNAEQVRSAIAFNASKLRDRRSVIAVQALVGAAGTAIWDADTIQRVARLQQTDGTLVVDGKIGQQTMREIGLQLEANGERNSLLRMIVDFNKLDENGLIDISFDPALNDANAVTDGAAIPGNSTVRVGPSGFTQGYEGLVHTVAHELEHVRQNRLGIADVPISEFLGERIEILSKGMLEEDMAGFTDDAGRALRNWNLMPVGQRRAEWGHFIEVRNKVRQRFRAATAQEQADHAQLLIDYNAVVRP